MSHLTSCVDLIKRYWKWRNKAHENLTNDSPYYSEFSSKREHGSSIPSGTSFGDNKDLVNRVRSDACLLQTTLVTDNNEVDSRTGKDIGTWGILSDYVQNTPAADFPPVNYKQYASMLVFDQFMKNLLMNVSDEVNSPLKSNLSDGKTGGAALAFPQVAVSVAVLVGALAMNPMNEAMAIVEHHEGMLKFLFTTSGVPTL